MVLEKKKRKKKEKKKKGEKNRVSRVIVLRLLKVKSQMVKFDG